VATGSEVRHDPEQDRYELLVGGEVVAVADYRDDGDRVVMHHTYTEPHHRGNGYAAQVVEGALDDLRSRGRKIVPTCWFVAEFVDSHPEYRDLVAERARFRRYQDRYGVPDEV
jgi:predicted GNAT family acetyltransferase